MARLPPNARRKSRDEYAASLKAGLEAIENPRPGLPNPDGYGTIYAVAPDGTAYVLDRKESYDRLHSPHAYISWAVHIRHAGAKRFEWNETYRTRRDAVAAIKAALGEVA